MLTPLFHKVNLLYLKDQGDEGPWPFQTPNTEVTDLQLEDIWPKDMDTMETTSQSKTKELQKSDFLQWSIYIF